MSEAQTTTDHDKIRQWVEARGGQPATVRGTGDGGVGVLRIDFPGHGEDAKMQHIGWDQFFEKFDREKLAFLFQDRLDSGQESRFCKFVERSSAGRR